MKERTKLELGKHGADPVPHPLSMGEGRDSLALASPQP